MVPLHSGFEFSIVIFLKFLMSFRQGLPFLSCSKLHKLWSLSSPDPYLNVSLTRGCQRSYLLWVELCPLKITILTQPTWEWVVNH